uniref:ADAM metallopeptidase domain 15 n=1 Tax=Neovison vison TaxID=452646 RepID=A0A8C7EUG6_NEOVI
MRLALLWALGLLGAGSPLSSRPLPDVGDIEKQQARPERALGGPLEPRIPPDTPTLSLAETQLPEALQIPLELDGEKHVLELLRDRELVPGRPSLTWYQPDGTRVVGVGHSLGNCCYQGAVRGHAGSWVSVCTCSGLRGLVILSPGRSYTLDLEPGDLRAPPSISRIQDLFLPGHTCAMSRRVPAPTQVPLERPWGQSHSHTHRRRRDVLTETKTIELVIVADHSEVQRYPDPQHLLDRMLKVTLLLDTVSAGRGCTLGPSGRRSPSPEPRVFQFFRPLNVRVALVGLEAWTQRDLVEISRDPGLTLHRFLRWRGRDLLPRLPHDSAQLVTAASFSGPTVGMAVQNSICSPAFSGGVNMDHSASVLGVASSIAHELGHSLGLDHDLPGSSCPCPGPAPAKSCIMEASTDFLPGLNFSNCSRQALEKALLEGMGSCLLERLPGLPSLATVCGNKLVEPGEQCDCGFPDDCSDPCCDHFTCQLRPGAQCASDGLCCHNCQLRPAGWQCRPTRGDCDLPEFCAGDSAQCPPDASLGDGEPCAAGEAVCVQGRCTSYAQQCQALWGPGAQPAPPPCLLAANTRGDAFGSCGRSANGSYMSCAPKDAVCGQLQCQGGRARPLLGTTRDLRWEVLEGSGTQPSVNCRWVHLDLGDDVAQPLLSLPGTACGPGLVCMDGQCQPVDVLRTQECWGKCHGHGVCGSRGHCHCEEGWAPPDCANRIRATSALTTGLPLGLLLLAVLTLLGASYRHRARLRQRLCQLKGPSCQYRAAQSGPPECPEPPQRVLLMPGAKGPAKPPPPRKPLPANPQGQRPSGDLPGPGAGVPPLVVPSRPAPPPPAASSLYL